jgi:hypothetical protein
MDMSFSLWILTGKVVNGDMSVVARAYIDTAAGPVTHTLAHIRESSFSTLFGLTTSTIDSSPSSPTWLALSHMNG